MLSFKVNEIVAKTVLTLTFFRFVYVDDHCDRSVMYFVVVGTVKHGRGSYLSSCVCLCLVCYVLFLHFMSPEATSQCIQCNVHLWCKVSTKLQCDPMMNKKRGILQISFSKQLRAEQRWGHFINAWLVYLDWCWTQYKCWIKQETVLMHDCCLGNRRFLYK